MTEKITLLTGREAELFLPAIADMRIAIFNEYPYLYVGTLESEHNYLAAYGTAVEACVLIVTDAGNIAGAATGIPLRLVSQELMAPFAATPYETGDIYYIGELLFYPAYRSRGMGSLVLQLLEERIRSLGRYRYLTCATVVRPDDHPLRPGDYQPIDRFLARTGFTRVPGVTTTFKWFEIDGQKCDHVMQFWLKEI